MDYKIKLYFNMKIKCLNDLDNFRLSRTKITFIDVKTKEYYTFKEECSVCGEYYMQNRRSNTNCCSLSCAQSGGKNHEFGKTKQLNNWYGKKHTKSSIDKISIHSKGKNNPSWKGGVIKKNLPLYNTYAEQLNFFEEVRHKLENNLKILEVKCKYCNKWFTPTRINVRQRVIALKGQVTAENNFYCSNNCKNACSTYGQMLFPKGFKKASSREVDSLVRKLCFERDDWKCQSCGASQTQLHCHHIEGYAQNPRLGNDVTNTITLCKKCHKEVHMLPGCTYNEYKCN